MGKIKKTIKKLVKEIQKPKVVQKVKEALSAVNHDFKKQIKFSKAIIKHPATAFKAAVQAVNPAIAGSAVSSSLATTVRPSL